VLSSWRRRRLLAVTCYVAKLLCNVHKRFTLVFSDVNTLFTFWNFLNIIRICWSVWGHALCLSGNPPLCVWCCQFSQLYCCIVENKPSPSAKTAAVIELLFLMWTRVGQRNHVLDVGMRKVNFEGEREPLKSIGTLFSWTVRKRLNRSMPFRTWNGMEIGATCRILLNRSCAATMRPYVELLWPLVVIRGPDDPWVTRRRDSNIVRPA